MRSTANSLTLTLSRIFRSPICKVSCDQIYKCIYLQHVQGLHYAEKKEMVQISLKNYNPQKDKCKCFSGTINMEVETSLF